MFNRVRRRVFQLVCRAIGWPRAVAYRLISSNSVIGSPHRFQPIQCMGLGKVEVGENVSIGFFPSPFFFTTYAYIEARNASAIVTIGAWTKINNNFCAIAEHTSITIGSRCLIGANVEIIDSDFHGLKILERDQSRREWARPVHIGNDVFLGSNVKILKGVSIGDGSVVANGSIVVMAVPPGVVVGGNPAKILKVIPRGE